MASEQPASLATLSRSMRVSTPRRSIAPPISESKEQIKSPSFPTLASPKQLISSPVSSSTPSRTRPPSSFFLNSSSLTPTANNTSQIHPNQQIFASPTYNHSISTPTHGLGVPSHAPGRAGQPSHSLLPPLQVSPQKHHTSTNATDISTTSTSRDGSDHVNATTAANPTQHDSTPSVVSTATVNASSTTSVPTSTPAICLFPFVPPAVFLGGSCNPTTWRQDTAIPLLTAANVSFFNPQTDHWTPAFVVLENLAKEGALVQLFVIDATTRALASMLEATELIARGKRVVLVVEDVVENTLIEGQEITGRQCSDLNRARFFLKDLASRHVRRVHPEEYITETATVKEKDYEHSEFEDKIEEIYSNGEKLRGNCIIADTVADAVAKTIEWVKEIQTGPRRRARAASDVGDRHSSLADQEDSHPERRIRPARPPYNQTSASPYVQCGSVSVSVPSEGSAARTVETLGTETRGTEAPSVGEPASPYMEADPLPISARQLSRMTLGSSPPQAARYYAASTASTASVASAASPGMQPIPPSADVEQLRGSPMARRVMTQRTRPSPQSGKNNFGNSRLGATAFPDLDDVGADANGSRDFRRMGTTGTFSGSRPLSTNILSNPQPPAGLHRRNRSTNSAAWMKQSSLEIPSPARMPSSENSSGIQLSVTAGINAIGLSPASPAALQAHRSLSQTGSCLTCSPTKSTASVSSDAFFSFPSVSSEYVANQSNTGPGNICVPRAPTESAKSTMTVGSPRTMRMRGSKTASLVNMTPGSGGISVQGAPIRGRAYVGQADAGKLSDSAKDVESSFAEQTITSFDTDSAFFRQNDSRSQILSPSTSVAPPTAQRPPSLRSVSLAEDDVLEMSRVASTIGAMDTSGCQSFVVDDMHQILSSPAAQQALQKQLAEMLEQDRT